MSATPEPEENATAPAKKTQRGGAIKLIVGGAVLGIAGLVIGQFTGTYIVSGAAIAMIIAGVIILVRER